MKSSPDSKTILDPKRNCVPESVNHIHLMGICGTGVGALAGMLQASGYRVTGSDTDVYPPMSDFLASRNIPVKIGYGHENLTPRPDLVIVGNVITRENPEAIALGKLETPYLSMPQALGHFFIAGKKSIVVTGTHGKTTTSSIAASVLKGAGMDPGGMIGGIVQAFGANFAIGQGDYFVVEGDEYDTAFFDKGPKFLHYRPHFAIITSIEFDHADIYADLEAVKHSFRRLVAIMPEDGLLVYCHDDPLVREMVEPASCRTEGYGLAEDADWRMGDLKIDSSGTSFSVIQKGEDFGLFHIPLAGRHNALNALSVIAVMKAAGISTDIMKRELAAFQGIRRRQEVRGCVRGVTVIDDFAHHPTAVRETLAALRQAYSGNRIIAVFEPRTNSSRRRIFQKEYPKVFDNADRVIVRDPVPLTKIPLEERFSAEELVADLQTRGIDALCFPDTDSIIEYLVEHCLEGDVVAILSNGGFDNIHTRLLKSLVY